MLDSGESFSIKKHQNTHSIFLKPSNRISCIHLLFDKCKISIQNVVLSERFRFAMENKNEIKCRW